MNISIKITKRKDMRPEVDGVDWFWDPNGDLTVQVAPMSDWRYEVLLAIHEVCEAVLCKNNGVSQESVDRFDQEFNKTHAFDVNAGDDPKSPYTHEHCVATAIERVMAAEMRVPWLAYDQELCDRYPGPGKKDSK